MPNVEVLQGNVEVIKPIQICEGTKCKRNAEEKNNFIEKGDNSWVGHSIQNAEVKVAYMLKKNTKKIEVK